MFCNKAMLQKFCIAFFMRTGLVHAHQCQRISLEKSRGLLYKSNGYYHIMGTADKAFSKIKRHRLPHSSYLV